MSKVLIATEKPFAAPAVAGIKQILTEAGFEVATLEKYTSKSELLAAVADAEAIIIRSDIIDAEVFDAAKQLKIVVRAGAGYDNVDLEAATAHGVCVMNTPGQNANAVAELVFAMLLFAVRNRFNGTSGTELKDKKLGLLAYGNTGRNVARIAKGIGMDIYAYDPFTPARRKVYMLSLARRSSSPPAISSHSISLQPPRPRALSVVSSSASSPRRLS